MTADNIIKKTESKKNKWKNVKRHPHHTPLEEALEIKEKVEKEKQLGKKKNKEDE